MLTGYVLCVPLKTKMSEEIIQSYIDYTYSKFGGSLKMLSGNGLSLKIKSLNKYPKNLNKSTK